MDSAVTQAKAERLIINLREKGLENAMVIGKYTYVGAREKLPTHRHLDIVEICYCDKGEQVYQVEKEIYNIKGGDVFITFPNEPHSTANYPEDKGCLYWLQLQIPQNAKKGFLGYSGKEAETLINSLLNIPTRHFKASASIKSLLEAILVKSDGSVDELTKLYLYNNLTNILLQLIKYAHQSTIGKASNERMMNVMRYIESNINNELSISQLAERENISESHFKSLFKKEFGITPMDYVLRKKIELAKTLLVKDSESTITDVAYTLRFCSSQYFSTVFKKYTGQTPRDFRGEQLN